MITSTGDAPPKRGRKPGSKVTVKGGRVKVKPPRKTKVSHGWVLELGRREGFDTLLEGINENSFGDLVERRELVSKSTKTAMRESLDIITKRVAGISCSDGSTLTARIVEVKYFNPNVQEVPQKPKIIL